MKKIDIHCHTTNRILKDVANPDASLAAIAAHMKRYDIVQTILLATYFPRRGTGISNYRLLHWLQGKSEFSMFGTDFPVQTHADSIYFIEQAMQAYSTQDRQKVYFDNANRIILKDRFMQEK